MSNTQKESAPTGKGRQVERFPLSSGHTNHTARARARLEAVPRAVVDLIADHPVDCCAVCCHYSYSSIALSLLLPRYGLRARLLLAIVFLPVLPPRQWATLLCGIHSFVFNSPLVVPHASTGDVPLVQLSLLEPSSYISAPPDRVVTLGSLF